MKSRTSFRSRKGFATRNFAKKSFMQRRLAPRSMRSRADVGGLQLLQNLQRSGADVTAVAPDPDGILAAASSRLKGVGKTQTIHYSKGPFPPRLFCRYRHSVQQTRGGPASTNPQTMPQCIAGNDIYRPVRLTGSGVPPAGATACGWFTQTQAYFNYYVHASRCHLDFEWQDAPIVNTEDPFGPGGAPLNQYDDLIVTLFATIIPPTQWLINPGVPAYIPATRDQLSMWNVPHVSRTISLAKRKPRCSMSLFVKTQDIYALDELQLGFGGAFSNTQNAYGPSSPTYVFYYGVLVMAATQQIAGIECDFAYRLQEDFFTECWNPMQQTDVPGKHLLIRNKS